MLDMDTPVEVCLQATCCILREKR